MHVIGCLLVFILGLEAGTDKRTEEKNVAWRLADGAGYLVTGVYMHLVLSLYREKIEDSILSDFGTKGTLLVCLITIALQVLQMFYFMSKKMKYEYVPTQKKNSKRKVW